MPFDINSKYKINEDEEIKEEYYPSESPDFAGKLYYSPFLVSNYTGSSLFGNINGNNQTGQIIFQGEYLGNNFGNNQTGGLFGNNFGNNQTGGLFVNNYGNNQTGGLFGTIYNN